MWVFIQIDSQNRDSSLQCLKLAAHNTHHNSKSNILASYGF